MVAPTESIDDAEPDDGGVVAVASGELSPGEVERFDIVLVEDVAYDVYVTPYDPTVDFDLGVFDADGELLVRDVDVAAEARCRINPESTGQYILVVTSVRGASGYDIAVTRAEPDVLAAGTIHQGEALAYDLVLEMNRRYRIAVVADDAASDLDLTVFDQNGNKVAEDVSVESNAYCEVVPLWTGTFRLVVTSARGDSDFAIVAI